MIWASSIGRLGVPADPPKSLCRSTVRECDVDRYKPSESVRTGVRGTATRLSKGVRRSSCFTPTEYCARLRADGVTLVSCLGTAGVVLSVVPVSGLAAELHERGPAFAVVFTPFCSRLSGGLRENLAASLSLRLSSRPDSPPLVSQRSMRERNESARCGKPPTSAPSRGNFRKLYLAFFIFPIFRSPSFIGDVFLLK